MCANDDKNTPEQLKNLPDPGENKHYDYDKMLEYCKDNRIEPLRLTQEELRQFIASQIIF